MSNPIRELTQKLYALRREFEGKLTPAGLAEALANEACDALDGAEVTMPDARRTLELIVRAIEGTARLPQTPSDLPAGPDIDDRIIGSCSLRVYPDGKVEESNALSIDFTLHLSEPLTDEERRTIIGNIYAHIFEERDSAIPGFAKVQSVDAPDGYRPDRRRLSTREANDLLGGTE